MFLHGQVMFTSQFAKTIEIIEPGQNARTLASRAIPPVSILTIDDGFIIAAHEGLCSGSRPVAPAQLRDGVKNILIALSIGGRLGALGVDRPFVHVD